MSNNTKKLIVTNETPRLTERKLLHYSYFSIGIGILSTLRWVYNRGQFSWYALVLSGMALLSMWIVMQLRKIVAQKEEILKRGRIEMNLAIGCLFAFVAPVSYLAAWILK